MLNEFKKKLKGIGDEAMVLTGKLLAILPTKDIKYPARDGVYLIYNHDKIIYVGKATNLRRRIEDHMGGDLKMSTSTFRRKLHSKFNIEPGKSMRCWIEKNCFFSYIEIADADIRSLVEAFLIAILRKSGAELFNAT